MKRQEFSIEKPPILPSAVYRLQFSRDFTFEKASALAPYLKSLGVDFLYCSPYFQSASGNPYHLTDPNKLSPEIGSEEDYDRFCQTLDRLHLGQILDIVPNHMGISGNGNRWWMDVLENGPASSYSHFFDIDWNPVKKEIIHKVLLPILGDHYGTVLENGEIQLIHSEGRFFIQYYERDIPLAPETFPMILEYGLENLQLQLKEDEPHYLEYLSIITAFRNLPPRTTKNIEERNLRNREKEIAKRRLAELSIKSEIILRFIESRIQILNGTKGEARSFDRLDLILKEQAYRLAYWRVASEEINFRRFFDINELAAIHTENQDVFENYHRLIFQLIQEKKVHGLRIDHPDGLYDPSTYFRRLQDHYAALSEEENALFVVAEKILDRKESLPEDWQIHGTVGYDFLNTLNGLFVKRENETAFDEIYEKFIGRKIDFNQLIYEKKKFFCLIYMSSEINALGHRLDRISERQRRFRDFTRNNLTLAIREVIACFPVYRTYISLETKEVSERDQRYIEIAIEKARNKTPYLIPAVYDFVKRVLLLQWDAVIEREDQELYLDFVLRFQQITGPVMAKGLEDTAFYIYNRLLSLNEVGGDPTRFGVSVEEFHSKNLERNRRFPFSFLASSTHDNKRSEDARLRIDVLSELPKEWESSIEKWVMVNKKHKTQIRESLEPDANLEYFIYQTLIAAWPDEPLTPDQMPAFADRMWNYFLKSIREAKLQTSWVFPNDEYEAAVKKFVEGILVHGTENHFLMDFLSFQEKVASFALWNSLSALVLKLGSPGIVDTYQGCELWNYSLVDPDNRRPVDYEVRKNYLKQIEAKGRGILPEDFLQELIGSKKDGRIKLYILWKGLNFRKENYELFLGGDYTALKIEGSRKDNVVAFLREKSGERVLVAAARFFTELTSQEIWRDTAMVLPSTKEGTKFKDIFTGRTVPVSESGENRVIKIEDLFQTLSVGILKCVS